MPPELLVLEAAHVVAESVYYLAYTVSTLAIVGLMGYWVALRAARPKR